MTDDYESHDALGLAELVTKGDATPVELVDAAIDRIEARNAAINAVTVRQFETARKQASNPDKLPDGPFRGVPYMLKDLGYEEAGVNCTHGSRAYKDLVASVDIEMVARLKAAGLIIVGRTSSPEGGLCGTTEPILHGPCRNPWNTTRTPGGSSGGSGAVVAAGIVPAASASDGGGSIRIPASCCGLFGLKPTRSRVSGAPLSGDGWNGLATKHALTRSVRDSAALLDVVAGYVPGDPYPAPPAPESFLGEVGKPPGTLRIAVSTRPLYDAEPASDCVDAVDDAAKLCEELGHSIETGDPPIDRPGLAEAFITILAANVAASHVVMRNYLGREPDDRDVEPWSLTLAELGRDTSAGDVARCIHFMHTESRKVATFHETYDLHLTPTLAKPPIEIGELSMQFGDMEAFMARARAFSPYTRLANMTGQPSMSVPLYWNAENLPVGAMFTSRFGDEAMLIRLAAQLEEARPWFDRRPGGL